MTTGRVLVALLIAALAAGAVGAYAGLREDRSEPGPSAKPLATSTPEPSAEPTPSRTPRPRRPRAWVARAALARDVKAIEARGPVGVALRPLDDGEVVQTGSTRDGAAWSTMKVPVVLSRLRLGAGDTADRSRRALTASDNAAAQSLFDDISESKGGLVPASRFVQESLREAGDEQTVVNTEVPAGGFSTFGQTNWSLAAGTRFFAALERGCLEPRERDDEVTDLMTEVVADQRWGIGSMRPAGLTSVAFKGGWGPDPGGRYLVRQFGILRGRGGRGVVVALLAKPRDGSFETGVSMLTELAQATSRRLRLASAPKAATCD